MAKPTVIDKDSFDQWRVKINQVSENIGDPDDLTTTVKTDAVSAINEVQGEMEDFQDQVGLLAELMTTDKDSIVDAINETHADVISETNALEATLALEFSNVNNAIDDVNVDIAQLNANVGNLPSLTTDVKTSIVNSINEVTRNLLANYSISAVNLDVANANIVDVFLYDTSKDSDFGMWRFRCQTKSWYTETLNTATRGATREFPAIALIVAETANVKIFDATVVGCPMWRIFGVSSTSAGYGILRGLSSYPITAVCMMNGKLSVGINASDANGGIHCFDFIGDKAFKQSTALCGAVTPLIAYINTNVIVNTVSYPVIVNNVVNDVAMTVIPSAPIDALTGLPVPTIVVATAGGVSIIDGYAGVGTVIDQVYGAEVTTDCAIIGTRLFWTEASLTWFAADLSKYLVDYSNASAGAHEANYSGRFYYNWNVGNTSIPAPIYSEAVAKCIAAGKALGSTRGLTLLEEDTTIYPNGMVAHITKDYNTGWMKGDIRRAIICDALGTTETIANTMLITSLVNFGSTYDYETLTTSGKDVISAINSSGNAIAKSNKLDLVVGRLYQIVIDLTLNSGTAPFVSIKDSVHAVSGGVNNVVLVNGANTINFIFTTVNCDYFYFYNSSSTNFAAIISIKEVIPDHSVKATSMTVNGTLTRSPVATGAELQAISGFSTSEYLTQPYYADLDFGTGDFYICGWIKATAVGPFQTVCQRMSTAGTGSGFLIYYNSTGRMQFFLTNDGWNTYDSLEGLSVLTLSQYYSFHAVKRGSKIEIWVNGVKENEMIVTKTLSLSNATATLQIGAGHPNVSPLVSASLSLLRIGVGAPSQSQIEKMHADELPLFQPNALCTLQGTSNSVNALDYDRITDLLHVGSTDIVTSFSNLSAVSSELSGQNIKSISSFNRKKLTGTATKFNFTNPETSLLHLIEEVTGALRNTDIKEDYLGLPAVNDMVLFSDTAGNRSWGIAPTAGDITALDASLDLIQADIDDIIIDVTDLQGDVSVLQGKIPFNIDSALSYGAPASGSTVALLSSIHDTHVVECPFGTLILTAADLAIGRTVNLLLYNAAPCTITWPQYSKFPDGVISKSDLNSRWDRYVMQKISNTEIHISVSGLNFLTV